MSPSELDADFETLLEYLRDNRGFDFTGYKRSSLMRRVRKRMHEVGVEGFPDYVDHLEVHPDEFAQLFDTILINVTCFYRDPPAWQFLARSIVPAIVERKRPSESIRIWSAGCASGEEPYTAAMVIADVIGPDATRDRVKIYATDVDEDALTHARHATYTAKEVERVPAETRARYLEPANGRFTVAKELRRSVIFGRHDLTRDAPISRVDLVICRNTLMYFNAEAQTGIYQRFHFALNPDGFLFVGKSEMLLTRTALFSPVDLKHRVFARVSRRGERRDEVLFLRSGDGGPARERGSGRWLREAAFEGSSIATVVVAADGTLVAANAAARSRFAVAHADLGRPFQDLELSFRPTELRSKIAQALADRRPVVERAVRHTSEAGEPLFLDVQVAPLLEQGEPFGTAVTFTDVTAAWETTRELERSRKELETAYEELQSTVEELETTNEELQSTNEELETTNEELQSTNEELETMNEELQSTNEELETINVELRDRTRQLNEANLFLGAILASLRAAVIVLDTNLGVMSWNAMAEELWGLRQDEVRGRHLLNLDIGLPLDALRDPIRACLAGVSELHEASLDATNRRGRAVRIKVTVTPMRDDDGEIHGAILLIEDAAGVAIQA